MATYGNTGGNGLNINVYSGSGGNLNEWALDYDGLKLLTIPEVITASNITTNQTVTVTLKAKPIFNNISVSFFRVKLPDGSIAEYPAINNTAIFTTPIAGALGSQQTLLVYARDNSGNRSAVASHLYTVVNSLPPSTSTITHNIPSSFSAGDVKQIQISGAVDPEGDPYTYSLILPPEISGSKISGIANNETVTLTVQNTIDYTKQDNIVIRVTDINGAQDDKVLTVTLLSGGSSGGTNNFNVRTSFPSSVYPNEVFTAKIWELGTNNYTYGLNLPSGITASKTSNILSNENFTITIAPNVAPNSTVSIDVVVYTGSVSVGSFVVNMLVDGVSGEMSYTTPGTYEFTVPNTVNSLSMLQVYPDKIIECAVINGGFNIENLAESNVIRKAITGWSYTTGGVQQMNNMIFDPIAKNNTFKYTLDNFDTIKSSTMPNSGNYAISRCAYGNGSYLVSGIADNSDGGKVKTYLSVNNGSTWSVVSTASRVDNVNHHDMQYYNSTFYINMNGAGGLILLVSVDGGYTFVQKPLPDSYKVAAQSAANKTNWLVNKDGYFIAFNDQQTNLVKIIRSVDRGDSWAEIEIPDALHDSNFIFRYINGRYVIIHTLPTVGDKNVLYCRISWTDDLINWQTNTISSGTISTWTGSYFGNEFLFYKEKYLVSVNRSYMYLNDSMVYSGLSALESNSDSNVKYRSLIVNDSIMFGISGANTAAISLSPTDSFNGIIEIRSVIQSHTLTSPVSYFYANNEVVSKLITPSSDPQTTIITRIKSTSTVQTNNGAYLANDFSDKNVVTSQIVPSMSFKAVVSSGNNLIAINRLDYKVYKNISGTSTWDLIPELVIDQNSDKNNIHVFGNTIIFNAPASTKMYVSLNSGNTWSAFTTSGYSRSVLYKGKIYSTRKAPGPDESYRFFEFNINNSTETQLSPSPGGHMYVLNNVLVACGYTDHIPYYFDENYLVASNAFKSIADININYTNKFPQNSIADRWSLRNYSTKFIIGDYNSNSVSLYDETVKNITLNDIINNQVSTLNILNTGLLGTTNGLVDTIVSTAAELRVYDDFIIYINNFIISISIDGGKTYTSINTNATVNDVVVCNGIIYIFSGNTVKKIVPSILDNSNIINKEPNIGYSLTNPKLAGNFGKNGYAKYLNNIEVTPGDKLNINVSSPDGGVRLVWGTNRFFPTNAS